jgi:hypothetical protein
MTAAGQKPEAALGCGANIRRTRWEYGSQRNGWHCASLMALKLKFVLKGTTTGFAESNMLMSPMTKESRPFFFIL